MSKIPDQYHGVDGHLKMIEAEYLYNAPFRLGDGWYGNIGTMHGRSTVHLAGGVIESQINGVVITVDIKPHDAAKTFRDYGVDHVIDFSLEGSIKAAKEYPDDVFRLVFIDGDHSYKGVKADFEAWEYKISEGGELAFHDSNVEGVKKLLEEIQAGGAWDQVGLVHTLSWWKRVA